MRLLTGTLILGLLAMVACSNPAADKTKALRVKQLLPHRNQLRRESSI
jgi:hypothetical protein